MTDDEIRAKASADATGSNNGGYAVGGGYAQSGLCDPSNRAISQNGGNDSVYIEAYANAQRGAQR